VVALPATINVRVRASPLVAWPGDFRGVGTLARGGLLFPAAAKASLAKLTYSYPGGRLKLPHRGHFFQRSLRKSVAASSRSSLIVQGCPAAASSRPAIN